MQLKKNVLYIGEDKGYWQAVIARFKGTYGHVDFNFIHFPPCSGETINTQLLEVLEAKPSFIYIDLSSSTALMYQLGQYIKRTHAFSEVPLVGLIENKSHVEETLLLKFDFVFVKCAEMHDVVYHPYVKAFPKEALKKEFALAKTKIPSTISEIMRIGYYSEDSMHIECDSSFDLEDELFLNHNLPRDVMKSQYFTIKKKSSQDLYYSYKYTYDLEYHFIDDPIFDDSDLEEANDIADEALRHKVFDKVMKLRDQKIDEVNQERGKLKKFFKNWINENKEAKFAKRTKIFVVDEFFSFLEKEKRKLDSFPFTVRIETHFKEDFLQIDQYLPHLIVFKIPDVAFTEEELVMGDSDKKGLKQKHEARLIEFFSRLIGKVKSIPDYSPFVIIFNCQSYTSKAFQDSFKYDLILTNPNQIDFNLIVKMADLYQAKQDEKFKKSIDEKIKLLKKSNPTKYAKLSAKDFEENRFYVSKKSPFSKATIDHEIMIKAISESEVYFWSDKEIVLGNYQTQNPFPMVLSLVKQDDKDYISDQGKFLYKSLIHSIGENDKKELRRVVNDIYTAHKKKEREKEEKAFLELNAKVQAEADAANAEDEASKNGNEDENQS